MPSSKMFLLTIPRWYFFCGSFVLFMSYVMVSRLFVTALLSLAGKWLTSWSLFVMFNCVFVTFPCGILCQVWYLIVSVPDLCHLSYFENILTISTKQGCLFLTFCPFYLNVSQVHRMARLTDSFSIVYVFLL